MDIVIDELVTKTSFCDSTGSLYELDDYGESFHLKLKNLLLPSLVLGIRPLAR